MFASGYSILNDCVDHPDFLRFLSGGGKIEDRLSMLQRHLNSGEAVCARLHGDVLYITENLLDRDAPCILVSRNTMQHGSGQYIRQLRRGDVLIQVFDHGATDEEEARDRLGYGSTDTRVWFCKEGRVLLC